MAFSCNIDRRGRWMRGASGLVVLLVAVVLALAVPFEPAALRWGIVVVLALLGAFQLFEAGRGWCIVRAMGFKTPI